MPDIKCPCCGSPLSDPVSTHPAETEAKQDDSYPVTIETDAAHEYIPGFPFESCGLVTDRTNTGPATNVPHVAEMHSPNGFEWGYSRPGAYDLALNAVEHLIQTCINEGIMSPSVAGARLECQRGSVYWKAFELHKSFRNRFLVEMDESGGDVPFLVLRSWLETAVVGPLNPVITTLTYDEAYIVEKAGKPVKATGQLAKMLEKADRHVGYSLAALVSPQNNWGTETLLYNVGEELCKVGVTYRRHRKCIEYRSIRDDCGGWVWGD